MAKFTDLPVELQTQILAHLDVIDQAMAACVNQIWSSIVHSPSLRKTRYNTEGVHKFLVSMDNWTPLQARAQNGRVPQRFIAVGREFISSEIWDTLRYSFLDEPAFSRMPGTRNFRYSFGDFAYEDAYEHEDWEGLERILSAYKDSLRRKEEEEKKFPTCTIEISLRLEGYHHSSVAIRIAAKDRITSTTTVRQVHEYLAKASLAQMELAGWNTELAYPMLVWYLQLHRHGTRDIYDIPFRQDLSRRESPYGDSEMDETSSNKMSTICFSVYMREAI